MVLKSESPITGSRSSVCPEPQQRVHSPRRLDLNSPTSLAVELASESKSDRIPYERLFDVICRSSFGTLFWQTL